MVGILVVNGYKSGWTGEYVGRPGKGKKGSPLANPFPLSKYSREESLKRYKQWLWDNLQNKQSEQFLEIKRLAEIFLEKQSLQLDCFCKPKDCHRDIIKAAIFWFIRCLDERKTP